ncbi:AraC-type DNA-binding protein [Paenibacillus uliginis N3/975]|uniref:AraC-type DNA-binding protein n=2 Tax=Paenibacillus TaxID=44249 RepID=A0A1X7HL38_9BACL|nr:AraC-type DNA-binding protein [Paenibacillus uliginis N3/975]
MKPVSFMNELNGQLQLHQPFDFHYRNDKPMASGEFHSHPFYEIFYFHEGKCTYLIGDKIYVLKPGDLLLMNGLTLHCPHVEPDARYVRSIVHFDPGFVGRWLQPAAFSALLSPFEELSNYRITLEGPERAEFEGIMIELERLTSTGAPQERRMLRLIDMMCFIADLCRTAVNHKESYPEKERHIQQVITFVEQNYMKDLSLEEIAHSVHLTKHYLSSLFKEVTGTTVFKYVYSRRINQAKMLLWLHPNLTVTEVCYAAGFKHLAHFSRMFKEMVGLTPEDYRNSRLSSLT